jgi:hypothetical protein
MPPLQALAALHGLWGLVFLPLVIGAIRFWPARRLWLAGQLVTFAAVMGLAVLIGLRTVTWLPKVPSEDRCYLPQRVIFVLATLPEVPLVQTLFAAGVCWIAGRRRIRLAHRGRGPQLPGSPRL